MRLGWGAARSAWQGIFKIMWPGFRFNCLMTVLDCPLANLTALVVLQFLSELPLSDSAVPACFPFQTPSHTFVLQPPPPTPLSWRLLACRRLCWT
jgi:hypothetical protein